MNAHGGLGERLIALARKSVDLEKACNNDASVRLYLVLPLIGLLGYDSSDPLEVYPNHETDAVAGKVYRTDFAILAAGMPTIAVTTARTPNDLAARTVELAGYFNGWPSTRLAIASDGIRFDVFVDSVEPGRMDAEPFLTFDMRSIAADGVPAKTLETLGLATRSGFDADRIAEAAHLKLIARRLRTALIEEAQAPSEAFCRAMMNRIGFANVRKAAIDRHYAGLLKSAFEEALIEPVVERLRGATTAEPRPAAPASLEIASPGPAATEREQAIAGTIRQRLAYLVDSEAAFTAIDRVVFKDYVGKVVVFYHDDPRGRLFELIRGRDGYDTFIFPAPHGEIVTNAIASLDEALRATFEARVREIGRAGDTMAPNVASRARRIA